MGWMMSTGNHFDRSQLDSGVRRTNEEAVTKGALQISKRIAKLGLCTIVVSSLACHESTAPPSPYAGGYQLVSVGGTPVPAPWNGTTVMCSTITLGNDGSYTRSAKDTVYSGGSAQLTTTVQTGRWRVSGITQGDPTLAATLTDLQLNHCCVA